MPKRRKLISKPPTPAQMAARKRNYNLFLLSGIRGHLGNIYYQKEWSKDIKMSFLRAMHEVDNILTEIRKETPNA